jgi:MoxR-like ATPase
MTKLNEVMDECKKVLYGQDDLIKGILSALVCKGHILVEGMPGLGKTLSISLLGKLCELKFQRIQFTPDLMPSDLIGTMIYSAQKEEFQTKLGPIFTQLLLADEINRSPAKVQAALLEAMAEKQVTIGEETFLLPKNFLVMATQNPIEQEGTYNLPEAQLDRFMIKVQVEYPSFEEEKKIILLRENPLKDIKPVLSEESLEMIREDVEKVYVDPKIEDLIIKIVHSTRPGNSLFSKKFENIIISGASPRASLWMYKLSKFEAYFHGRDYVSPEDILNCASQILNHRIILSYEAVTEKIPLKDLIESVIKNYL